MRNGFLLGLNWRGGLRHVACRIGQIPKPLHQGRHFHDPGLRLVQDDPHHDAQLCFRRRHLIDRIFLGGFQRGLQGFEPFAGLVGVLQQARQANGHFPDMRARLLSRVRHGRDGFRHGHDGRAKAVLRVLQRLQAPIEHEAVNAGCKRNQDNGDICGFKIHHLTSTGIR